MRKVRMRSVLRFLLSLLGLGIFGTVLYLGGAEAWRQIARADPLWLGASFVCTAMLTWISAARWRLVTHAVVGSALCPTRAYYHYLMMGKTAGLVLPEAVGVYTIGPLAMKLDGQSSFRLAFGTLFLDKLFDLGLSGALLIPTALYALRLISLRTCAVLFGLVFLLLALLLRGWYGPLIGLGLRLRGWIARRLSKATVARRLLQGRGIQALLAMRPDQVPSRGIVLRAYGITLLRYLLMTLRFATVSISLRIAVPTLLLFVGIPIAQLGLLLAVTPGALGALEAGWLGVLLLAGLPRQDIMTFLIGQRAALFAFISVLGLISYLAALAFPLRQQNA